MSKKAQPFPEVEWAFHQVPQGELRLCAEWELVRLAGRKQKPWLELAESEKQKLRRQTEAQGGLLEIPNGFLNDFSVDSPKLVSPKLDSELGVVAFVVDFSESESILRHAFRHWLRSSPKRKLWRKKSMTLNARWRSLLAKIVVLRASEAGLTREAAIEITGQLWTHWKFDQATAGFLSPPHWSRALREAKSLRETLIAQTSMAIGNPPFEGAAFPGLLLFLDEFPALARRRRLRKLSPKL